MGIRIQHASLSLGASVDQQTGNLSVFDIVDELKTPQVPIHLQSLVIALSMVKTAPGEMNGKMFIHLVTPDGKNALVGQGDMQIPADQRRMKAVFRFGGFPIPQFGEYRFVLSWLNETGVKQGEALLNFEVVQVTQVAQGAQPSEKPPFNH